MTWSMSSQTIRLVLMCRYGRGKMDESLSGNGNTLELIPSAPDGAHLTRWVMAEETRHGSVT